MTDDAKPRETRPRDRLKTQESILAAARKLLEEQGFAGWGVNAVARAAGCDKQLVYRYFGGMAGLSDTIGAELTAWLEAEMASRHGDMPPTRYAELMSRLALAYLETLNASRLAQRILAWEVSEESLLVKHFAAARARVLSAWIAKERGTLARPGGVDAPAANVLLIAAVQHIVLAGAATRSMMGLRLETEEEWGRMRGAVTAMVGALYPEG